MPQTTPHLALPLIAAAQAGKHVTHNEALADLDTLVQLACLDKDRTAPPAAPAEGDRYLVAAAAPTGAWTGLSGRIVRFQDGAWAGFVPKPGWLAYVLDEADLYVFDGAAWTSVTRSLSVLQNLALLGLGTLADAGTPFAAKLNAALWTARGTAEGGTGDLRTVLNKASAGNVLSLLLQTGFSGRAEIGLVGDDGLTAKVSADGAAWAYAWRVQPSSGFVGFGSGAAPNGPAPAAPLFVSGSSSNALLQLESYSGSAPPVVNITARIARGTPAAPVGILAGDRFFGFFGRGYQASGGWSNNMVTFNGAAEEDFTATAQGTLVDFQTTEIGTVIRRTVVRFRGNGALELIPRTAVPTLGVGAGQIVFDGTAAAFKGYNGTRWSRLTNLPRFSASLSANATIAAATWTKVAFNTADVNDQGAFVTATSRFVAPEPGTYTFGAGLAFRKTVSATPTAFQAQFYRNGAAAGRSRAATGLVDAVSTVTLTATLALNAGDTVEVFAHFTGAEGGIVAADSGFWGLAVP